MTKDLLKLLGNAIGSLCTWGLGGALIGAGFYAIVSASLTLV